MKVAYVDEAVELLEKANADLEPELLTVPDARERLEVYARARRLVDFGIAALGGKIDNAASLARVTGTSLGAAKETVATGKVLGDSPDLGVALQHGDISLEQANEIAKAEAERLARAARAKGDLEPFERHLADGYAKLLTGAGKGRARRPELVVLVSHEIVKRGWKDVREGEVCKIPGVGPVAPEVAKEIARDAFLNGVFYDGKDLRHFVRYSKHIPVEIAIALELGDPPAFDGVTCADCGNRFRTEFDHVEPRAARGPTSNGNIDPRCWNCHQEKTKRDRKAGKFKPPDT